MEGPKFRKDLENPRHSFEKFKKEKRIQEIK